MPRLRDGGTSVLRGTLRAGNNPAWPRGSHSTHVLVVAPTRHNPIVSQRPSDWPITELEVRNNPTGKAQVERCFISLKRLCNLTVKGKTDCASFDYDVFIEFPGIDFHGLNSRVPTKLTAIYSKFIDFHITYHWVFIIDVMKDCVLRHFLSC